MADTEDHVADTEDTSTADTDGSPDVRGKSYTVSSRRIPHSVLQLVAEMLELPTRASSDELRQLIESQLDELEQDARNLQIVLKETESSLSVSLISHDGVFKSIEKNREPSRVEGETTSSTLQQRCVQRNTESTWSWRVSKPHTLNYRNMSVDWSSRNQRSKNR